LDWGKAGGISTRSERDKTWITVVWRTVDENLKSMVYDSLVPRPYRNGFEESVDTAWINGSENYFSTSSIPWISPLFWYIWRGLDEWCITSSKFWPSG
jgi:hypothetical protein